VYGHDGFVCITIDVCECVRDRQRERVCDCVCEREREGVCVWT